MSDFSSQLVDFFRKKNWGKVWGKSWWDQFRPHCSPGTTCTSSLKIPVAAFCGCFKTATSNRGQFPREKIIGIRDACSTADIFNHFQKSKKVQLLDRGQFPRAKKLNTKKTNKWWRPGGNGFQLKLIWTQESKTLNQLLLNPDVNVCWLHNYENREENYGVFVFA